MSCRFAQRVIAASAMGVAWLAAPAAEAQTGPDLRIVTTRLTASSEGLSGVSEIRFSATIRNAGDTESAATTLRYYRSADATISTSDTEEATEAIAAVAPSSTADAGSTLDGQSAPGTYYYGVCVDAVAGESDTTNNCSSAVQVPAVALLAPLLVALGLAAAGALALGLAVAGVWLTARWRQR